MSEYSADQRVDWVLARALKFEDESKVRQMVLEQQLGVQKSLKESISMSRDRLSARVAELEASLINNVSVEGRLRQQIATLGEQLEFDRSAVASGVTAIKNAVNGRDWLTEGRGPYEWNDDNWHKEFEAASVEILAAVEPLAKIAANWKDCPQTTEEVAKARIDLKRRVAKLEAKLAEADRVSAAKSAQLQDLMGDVFDAGAMEARAVAAEAALREAREAQRRIIQHVRFHRELGLEASTHGGDYGRGRAYGIECLANDIDAALAPQAEPQAPQPGTCFTCGCSLASVAGPNLRAAVCPVCDADATALDEDEAPADRREQAISFAFGNVSLHNPAVTREMVAEQYDRLHPAPEVVEFKFCPHCRQDFAGYKSRVACPACMGGKK